MGRWDEPSFEAEVTVLLMGTTGEDSYTQEQPGTEDEHGLQGGENNIHQLLYELCGMAATDTEVYKER